MKKQTKNWYIAITHFLTAGIFFPFGFIFLIILILNIFLKINTETMSAGLEYTILLPVYILGVWIGNIIAIKYINKNFITLDKKRVLNLSLLYFIILEILTIGFEKNILLLLSITVIEIVFYYLISKKYIAKYNMNKE